METQKTTTLTVIFSEVLANLAFMFADEDVLEPSTEDNWMETVISYQGASRGKLTFNCTRDFSILLASNLLGLDPEEIDHEFQ